MEGMNNDFFNEKTGKTAETQKAEEVIIKDRRNEVRRMSDQPSVHRECQANFNHRIDDLEDDRKEQRGINSAVEIAITKLTLIVERLEKRDDPWYKTTIGIFAIRAMIVMAVIIICAAIGIPMIEALKAIK
jgi:hypothetical protein